MNLEKILNKNVIDLNMKAKSKDEAIRHLSELLLKENYIEDIETFVDDIYLREEEGITGIGNFIAIPHGKSDSVKQIGIAIGRLDDEIEWETIDEQGVKLIFLFAVSNDTEYATNHMKLLSEIARKLGNDEAVAQLLESRTYEQLSRVFVQ
ncbi:PTS transporter subunit EIIA [Erysipelothrix sp. HDW6C]|uniref:PTS sugar transporter subunit IIA n=1 Tax=Erysipelothrix sp. HDW6C TaxID=2714930 RepID=UPI001407592E|nr:fructose PTS transporter subunit IIA [Erysipelothrix sp. HDW6C]QIK69275.1 PTS transporter subunit EIIA [Erysipelothrix sp. HDW6C]